MNFVPNQRMSLALLSAPGGLTPPEHPPGTPGNVRLNDAMSCGRPITFAVRPRKPVPQCGTDRAAGTSVVGTVGTLVCPAAHPHR
jgi:hypothetical protein